MNQKIKYILSVAFVCFFVLQGSAQCAMCRAVLENGDDTSQAEAINNGIVYLMAVPYVLVAGVVFIIYRKFRN
ncbi:hypothetical protein [Pustulibacterium marinum]|nr:hypothetical protein [Pustulibacterium marinum]